MPISGMASTESPPRARPIQSSPSRVKTVAAIRVVLQEGRIVEDGVPHDPLPAAAAAFGLPWGTDPAPHLLPPEEIEAW